MSETVTKKESLFAMLLRVRPGAFAEGIVYEDEHCVAFMDKYPAARGHTLVVPRVQAERLHELPSAATAALGAAVALVAARVVAATGCSDYNVLQNNGKAAGQEVPHVHFHIIPRAEADGIKLLSGPSESRPAPLPDTPFEGDLKVLRDALRSV